MTLTATITARDLDSLAACEGAVDATLYGPNDEPVGSSTLVVDHSGALEIWGDTIDIWADDALQSWIDAQPRHSEAINEVVGAVREAAARD